MKAVTVRTLKGWINKIISLEGEIAVLSDKVAKVKELKSDLKANLAAMDKKEITVQTMKGYATLTAPKRQRVMKKGGLENLYNRLGHERFMALVHLDVTEVEAALPKGDVNLYYRWVAGTTGRTLRVKGVEK